MWPQHHLPEMKLPPTWPGVTALSWTRGKKIRSMSKQRKRQGVIRRLKFSERQLVAVKLEEFRGFNNVEQLGWSTDVESASYYQSLSHCCLWLSWGTPVGKAEKLKKTALFRFQFIVTLNFMSFKNCLSQGLNPVKSSYASFPLLQFSKFWAVLVALFGCHAHHVKCNSGTRMQVK